MMGNKYLYVDIKRINAYYEQISSPNIVELATNDHFSIWPKWVYNTLQEGFPSRIEKYYSLYEKTVEVEQYIKRSNQFLPKRHSPLSKGRDFVYYEEKVLAQKIHINENIKLWISENSIVNTEKNKHGHLMLIEDFSEPDGEVKFNGGWLTTKMLSWHGKIDFAEIKEAEAQLFSSNPIQLLNNKNYLVSDPTKISVLYRVISTCRDEINGLLTSTLGYPIMISEE
jgi:hypothetical protein